MRRHRWLMLLALLVAALAVAGCGDDDDDDGGNGSADTSQESSSSQIQKNDKNASTKVTIGSKNFTEQKVLGEIYAQALEAAGYSVSKELNLGDEKTALKALEGGDISAYPEYTGTALLSFFGVTADKLPSDETEAYNQAKEGFAEKNLTALAPTPFVSSNEVAVTKETADKLGLEKISDLEGKSQDLTLYGSPECRQRLDCKLGLEEVYGLKFKKFVPVDIALRHEVLTKGQADVSIVFTTDPQNKREGFVLLEDDKGMFPPYNSTLVVRNDVIEQGGPRLREDGGHGEQGPHGRGHAGAERARRPRQVDARGSGRPVPGGVRSGRRLAADAPARPHVGCHPAVEPAQMLLPDREAVDDQPGDESGVDAHLARLGVVPDAQGEDSRRVEDDADHEQAGDALPPIAVAQHEEGRQHQPERRLEGEGQYPLQFHLLFYIIRSI